MRLHVAIRVLAIVLGCAGAVWGASTFAIFKRSAALDEVAAQIIRGAAFRVQTLRDQAAALEAVEDASYCEARGLRSDVVIRLRLAEMSLGEADIGHIDENMRALRTAIAKALSCSPTESYVWLSRFWLNSVSAGFKSSDIALLQMSYQEGPHEGWIMATRNHLALAIYPALPPDLAIRVQTEFAELLQPEYIDVAVNNFLGPGWPIHALLLNRIKDRPQPERREFARILDARGYDLEVPGVVRTGRLGRH